MYFCYCLMNNVFAKKRRKKNTSSQFNWSSFAYNSRNPVSRETREKKKCHSQSWKNDCLIKKKKYFSNAKCEWVRQHDMQSNLKKAESSESS